MIQTEYNPYLIEDISSILGTDQVDSVGWNCEFLFIQLDTIASLCYSEKDMCNKNNDFTNVYKCL